MGGLDRALASGFDPSGVTLHGDSRNNIVEDNDFRSNTVFGLWVLNSNDNTFTGNTLGQNDDDGVYSDYNLPAGPSPYPRDFILDQQGIKLHLYGKKEARPGRKMGHFNVLDVNLDAAIKTAEKVFDSLA